jgi:riboflavin kinase / FMN adenylyltransferase
VTERVPTAPRIYRGLDELDGSGSRRAVTIGNFDGVHAGHRRILRRVVALARERGWRAAAMIFEPHPSKVVAPERAPRLLATPDERCVLLAQEGIEDVLILPFGPRIAALSPEEFARDILVARLGAAAVIVGANFHFGYRQSGDTRRLSELGRVYGFLTGVVPEIVLRGHIISSSQIRRLLESGAVALAARLLDRPYWLEGGVVSGHKIGSTKTVPTLNLKTTAEVLPARGVYITGTRDLESGRRWPSITNIGYRPTFGGDALSIETHLLAPLGGDAPARIRVEFLRRVRDEIRFPDAGSLRAQILHDVARAQRFLRLAERLLYSKRVTH